MKWNKIKKNLNYYINWYVLGTIITLILIAFLSKFIPDYIDSQKPRDYSDLKEFVYTAYEIDPNILQFNDKNIAILKMDTLYLGVSGKGHSFEMEPVYNKDFYQCAGYFIVTKKQDSTLNIDVSHVCDMIDY